MQKPSSPDTFTDPDAFDFVEAPTPQPASDNGMSASSQSELNHPGEDQGEDSGFSFENPQSVSDADIRRAASLGAINILGGLLIQKGIEPLKARNLCALLARMSVSDCRAILSKAATALSPLNAASKFQDPIEASITEAMSFPPTILELALTNKGESRKLFVAPSYAVREFLGLVKNMVLTAIDLKGNTLAVTAAGVGEILLPASRSLHDANVKAICGAIGMVANAEVFTVSLNVERFLRILLFLAPRKVEKVIGKGGVLVHSSQSAVQKAYCKKYTPRRLWVGENLSGIMIKMIDTVFKKLGDAFLPDPCPKDALTAAVALTVLSGSAQYLENTARQFFAQFFLDDSGIRALRKDAELAEAPLEEYLRKSTLITKEFLDKTKRMDVLMRLYADRGNRNIGDRDLLADIATQCSPIYESRLATTVKTSANLSFLPAFATAFVVGVHQAHDEMLWVNRCDVHFFDKDKKMLSSGRVVHQLDVLDLTALRAAVKEIKPELYYSDVCVPGAGGAVNASNLVRDCSFSKNRISITNQIQVISETLPRCVVIKMFIPMDPAAPAVPAWFHPLHLNYDYHLVPSGKAHNDEFYFVGVRLQSGQAPKHDTHFWASLRRLAAITYVGNEYCGWALGYGLTEPWLTKESKRGFGHITASDLPYHLKPYKNTDEVDSYDYLDVGKSLIKESKPATATEPEKKVDTAEKTPEEASKTEKTPAAEGQPKRGDGEGDKEKK